MRKGDWKRFTRRHRFGETTRTHSRAGLPIYDERRQARLLRATDHIAERYTARELADSNRLRDAITVVKMYVSGSGVMVLGGDLLRRLARETYGQGLRPGRRAMHILFAVFIACAGFQTSALAGPPASSDCRARPTWCQDGYTCEPTSCTTRSTVALEGLAAQLVAARAERPRWFRPFVEGGLSWSPIDQRRGAWAGAGVQLWRLQFSAAATGDGAQLRAGFRREW